MSFDASFLGLMPHSIIIAPFSSETAEAVVTTGAGITYQGRVEIKASRVMLNDGREILSRGRVYLATTAAISVRDVVTLPAAFAPVNPPLLNVRQVHDEDGPHHTILYF